MSKRYRGGIISATPPTTTSGRTGVAKGVWTLQDQMQAVVSAVWPSSPATPTAPTSVSASANISLGATVSFTAPTDTGLGPITGYIVTSTPGNITATGSTSPIQVTGLTAGVSYTFKVAAINDYGTGDQSAASNSITAILTGAALFNSAGTFSWVVPAGVTSISMVSVGGGSSGRSRNDGGGGNGGGGGGLAWRNNQTVTPGETLTVVVGAGGNPVFGSAGQPGGESYVTRAGSYLVRVYGGNDSGGGYPITGSGFNGGNGGSGGYDACDGSSYGGGGGGAGGYEATGGNGGQYGENGQTPGGSTSGGGASGGYLYIGGSYAYCWGGGGGGGGNGLNGVGSGGAGGTRAGQYANGGGGGSGGNTGGTGYAQQYGGYAGYGGWPGGGGGGNGTNGNNACSAYPGTASSGATGGVRIVYPGDTRSFPSTNVGA